MGKAYDTGLEQNRANFAALTPMTFLARAADVFPHKLSTIHGDIRFTWAQTAERCRRLASALAKARRRQERHGRGHAAQHSRR